MSSLTLQQLLIPADRDAVLAIMLGVLQSFGFNTTAWQPGGTDRTRFAAIATAIAQVSSTYVADIAAGGFLDYATGTWLQLLAQQLFNINFLPATRTIGSMVLASGPAGYTIQPGEVTATFPSGNRYINTSGGALAVNSTLTLTFQSEFANSSSTGFNYVDPSNSNPTLVNALPGVTITNPAGTYSTVAQTGSGTGTLTLTGSPGTFHAVVIAINSTGTSSTAAWSYSLDGAPFVNAGSSSITNIGGSGINIALTDGAINPSFVQLDQYDFVCPGTWVVQQGVDVESDTALAGRCRNRFATLSAVPTLGCWELWATSVPNAGVTQVEVIQDSVINNRLNIIIAGPGGALPPASTSAVQAYLSARAGITDLPVVISPTPQTITYAANILVAVNQLEAAEAAIATALVDYNDSVGTNGTLRISAITKAITEVAGVIDVTGITVNGFDANLTLGSDTTFVIPSASPVLQLIYATQ